MPVLNKCNSTLVYFFSDFNFSKAPAFIQDEIALKRLANVSNLKHVVAQSQDMMEYELVNFDGSAYKAEKSINVMKRWKK